MLRGRLKYFTIAIEPELYDELRKTSYERGVSMAKIFRCAVKELLQLELDDDVDEDIEEVIERLT